MIPIMEFQNRSLKGPVMKSTQFDLAFAKKVREELEAQFGEEYTSFLSLMGSLRKEILSQGLPEKENRRIFRELVNSSLLEAIGKNNWNEVADILNTIMNTNISSTDVIQYIKAG